MTNGKTISENLLEGFLEGVAIDSLMWATVAIFPKLATPLKIGTKPIVIPPYSKGGIHIDDAIALLLVTVNGYYKGKTLNEQLTRILSGVGGAALISQFQPMPVKPPFLGQAKSNPDIYIQVDK